MVVGAGCGQDSTAAAAEQHELAMRALMMSCGADATVFPFSRGRALSNIGATDPAFQAATHFSIQAYAGWLPVMQ
jgi:hypothetical protein